MAKSGSTIPVASHIWRAQGEKMSIPIGRLWVTLEFERQSPLRLPRQCLLDTGAPLCVIPYTSHHKYKIVWTPIAGNWPASLTTWMGVPCDIGSVNVWLVPANRIRRGPFVLVAKFPRATPAALQNLSPPVLLGLNFLIDCRADLMLQCHISPNAGTISVP